jgi:hypothetical protein
VIADQYLRTVNNRLSTVVNEATVDRRYEIIQQLTVGQTVAQTASCWLNFPLWATGEKYHTVLATDEFFTYAEGADQQQQLIQTVVAAAQQRLIVTVRDFKNSHRDELNNHVVFHQQGRTVMVTDTVQPHAEDRQQWMHDTYIVDHTAHSPATVQHVGTVQRRAVYFKQLAKFCFDAGCRSFQVLANVLYRPVAKTHVEHVIVVDW